MIDKASLVTMVLISILLCKYSFLFKGKRRISGYKVPKIVSLFLTLRVMKLYMVFL